MKMPTEKINTAMFAPCGMNCLVCYKHCYHKKPCAGCLNSDIGKPEHCRKCKIKDCIKGKGLSYCFECPNDPCNVSKTISLSIGLSVKFQFIGPIQVRLIGKSRLRRRRRMTHIRGFIMAELKILNDNFEAENNSFLYYLHEENLFHETAFSELCKSISSLCHTHPHDRVVSAQICFIYGQVLKHIIYHFDPGDLSRISNLPCNYNEVLEMLDHIIIKYFSG